MLDGEFRDPRLAALYDVACPPGPDTAFFRRIAGEIPGSRILDIGCGTGQLTTRLAADGHDVTGIDPADASLDLARARPDGARVRWVRGTVDDAPDGPFDLALMTSHVAQFVADDADWRRTLIEVHRRLAPGGRLAFDARDPDDRRWERWNPAETRTTLRGPDGSLALHWTEVVATTPRADGGTTVSFVHHYEFDDGDRRASASTLAFRTEATLRRDLAAARFAVDRVVGGWDGGAVGHRDGELIVVARALPGTGMLR